MCPQPFRRKQPKGTTISVDLCRVSPIRPENHAPGLFTAAYRVIAEWSNVEAVQLRLFVDVLGGNQALAAKVYLSLRAKTAKNHAINTAIVNAGLPTDLMNIFNRLSDCSKSLSGYRDRLAHGQVFLSTSQSNHLVLRDAQMSEKAYGKDLPEDAGAINYVDDGLFVYTIKEMTDFAERMVYLSTAYEEFRISYRRFFDSEQISIPLQLSSSLSLAETQSPPRLPLPSLP